MHVQEPVRIQSAHHLRQLTELHGPLVPVSVAASLLGRSDTALRNRLARGTLRGFLADGLILVPLAPGQLPNLAQREYSAGVAAMNAAQNQRIEMHKNRNQRLALAGAFAALAAASVLTVQAQMDVTNTVAELSGGVVHTNTTMRPIIIGMVLFFTGLALFKKWRKKGS